MREPRAPYLSLFLLFCSACVLESNESFDEGDELDRGAMELGFGQGQRLFDRETFAGNGRTCVTCHGDKTGTVSPKEVQALFAKDPGAPLFRSIDSDGGLGDSYSRLLSDATIRVQIELPENVSLAEDPEARTVTLLRGIPTTLNTPALDPTLMLDGRAPDLAAQALGAVFDHYEPGREPTGEELALIRELQRSSPRFFSSPELFQYSRGGPAPELPEGETEAERRGRAFFLPDGLCGSCHGGPMLNETTEAFPIAPPGTRFLSVLVSELNTAGNPVRTFVFHQGGEEIVIESPDPGRALITGDPDDANAFKVSPLWGVGLTAPYFHDNSARTLEGVAEHYDRFFNIIGIADLSERDKQDVVAFMRLL